MTPRQQIAFSHFVSSGYHPFGAAAIVGNGCGESGVNLDSEFDRGARADHESGGFLEWRDSEGAPRKTRLAGFADARGVSRDDLAMQCDYTIWELGKYFAALDAQLRDPGERPIKNLTANFCWVFENPAPATAGLDNRIAHAEKAYADWQPILPPRQVAPATAPVAPVAPATAPPAVLVDATNAGRMAAVLDQMQAVRDAYAAQIVMLEKEQAVVDSAIDSFTKLLHVSPRAPLALAPPTEESEPMTRLSGISSVIGPNWATSMFGSGGLIAAGFAVYTSIRNGQTPDATQVAMLLGIISTGIGLLKAKDANVTGGTVPATTEAARRLN